MVGADVTTALSTCVEGKPWLEVVYGDAEPNTAPSALAGHIAGQVRHQVHRGTPTDKFQAVIAVPPDGHEGPCRVSRADGCLVARNEELHTPSRCAASCLDFDAMTMPGRIWAGDVIPQFIASKADSTHRRCQVRPILFVQVLAAEFDDILFALCPLLCELSSIQSPPDTHEEGLSSRSILEQLPESVLIGLWDVLPPDLVIHNRGVQPQRRFLDHQLLEEELSSDVVGQAAQILKRRRRHLVTAINDNQMCPLK